MIRNADNLLKNNVRVRGEKVYRDNQGSALSYRNADRAFLQFQMGASLGYG